MNTESIAVDGASKALGEIAVLAGTNMPMSDFLARLDKFNQSELPALIAAYGSERHAKAVLLKLSNIAIGKYQYRNRHAHLVARPFGLVVDPCNSCQLSCPGCVHRDGADKEGINWQSGNLKPFRMNSLLDKYGAYGISTRFFNWGEPLLNKQTPEFVAASRRFLMRTSISSNLSLPIDATALVESGLDYLIMSIDGATQETYQKYRKGGDLGLVLENVRKLVAAKKERNSFTPYLVWQYLLFDHTLEEMDLALQMAKELGVNEINFTNAYDVSWSDPSITRPLKPPMKQHILHFDGRAVMQTARASASSLDERIEDAWEIKWASQSIAESTAGSGDTCQWLYNDVVMDARGNLFPCCFEHKKTAISVYGNIDEDGDQYNSKYYKFSREYLAARHDPNKIESGCLNEGYGEFLPTTCLACPNKNALPNVNVHQLPAYFSYADTRGFYSREAFIRLSSWDE